MDWKQLSADFKQKYEGCWCHVTFENSKKDDIFWLSEVDVGSGRAPYLHLENEEVGEIILKYDGSKSDVEFKMPTVGLHQWKDQVFMLRRGYLRQWKAGLCQATMTPTNIYSRLFDGIGMRDEWSESLVRAVFQPQPTISIKQAVESLDDKLAIAISEEFAIGQSVTDAMEFLVFYYENPIGTLNPTSHRVVLREKQFQQEFEDFTRKINEKNSHAYYW